MTGLLSLGIHIERDFRANRIGIIYIMAGFSGSLLSALFMQNKAAESRTELLCFDGLAEVTVAEILINWSTCGYWNRSIATLVLAITLTFSFGLMLDVDNFAHIGGFVAGAL
ncbi:hypothetical protein R1flu_015266 [Riccia fluitans]|uniref:RHOMBOID-like protein n=1 Tax=Riccia fluitans TaxID=41844 RepID=A0ABD1YJ97_9MARC